MVLRGATLDRCGAPGRWSGVLAALVALELAGTAAAETGAASPWHRRTAARRTTRSETTRTRNPSSRTSSGTSARCTGLTPEPASLRPVTRTSSTSWLRVRRHDSGLCAADRATRKRFARDLRNLTLASPRVNRHQKSGKDAGEWVPDQNRCWFAGRVLEVKRAYGLTVDRREAAALDRIFSGCYGTEMELIACTAPSTAAREAGTSAPAGDDALARYDDNRNGRITCKEARRHGIAPVPSSHPAYQYMRDGDGDGVVCE